jgi:ligand-binding sensor domain-containing protein
VTTTWVAWCGPCNPNAAGAGFSSGLVVLSNAGGSYHVVNSFLTGGTSALPQRFITGVFVDPANAGNAYVTFSGYSRRWNVGPNDPGIGHVFQITGSTITDRSGDLIDAPANDVLVVNGDLVVGTDFGVYVSADNGATWSRLGTNLPNVVISQLYVTGGSILAATHGRGLWTVPIGGLP